MMLRICRARRPEPPDRHRRRGLSPKARPSAARPPVQSGIVRNDGTRGRRIGIVEQIFGLEIAAMSGEFVELPIEQRLRARRQSPHHGRARTPWRCAGGSSPRNRASRHLLRAEECSWRPTGSRSAQAVRATWPAIWRSARPLPWLSALPATAIPSPDTWRSPSLPRPWKPACAFACPRVHDTYSARPPRSNRHNRSAGGYRNPRSAGWSTCRGPSPPAWGAARNRTRPASAPCDRPLRAPPSDIYSAARATW